MLSCDFARFMKDTYTHGVEALRMNRQLPTSSGKDILRILSTPLPNKPLFTSLRSKHHVQQRTLRTTHPRHPPPLNLVAHKRTRRKGRSARQDGGYGGGDQGARMDAVIFADVDGWTRLSRPRVLPCGCFGLRFVGTVRAWVLRAS